MPFFKERKTRNALLKKGAKLECFLKYVKINTITMEYECTTDGYVNFYGDHGFKWEKDDRVIVKKLEHLQLKITTFTKKYPDKVYSEFTTILHNHKYLVHGIYRDHFDDNSECVIYFNYGVKHRIDGPAMQVSKDGKLRGEEWVLNNELHRIDGPAYTSWHEDGTLKEIQWFRHNKLHRENAPAAQQWNKRGILRCSVWYYNGEFHRENAPAINIWHKDGTQKMISWSINGKLHREGAAAFQSWHKNGQLQAEIYKINGLHHRVDGAVYCLWNENGIKLKEYWFMHGKPHREGNAAIREWDDDGNLIVEEWCEHGIYHDNTFIKKCLVNELL